MRRILMNFDEENKWDKHFIYTYKYKNIYSGKQLRSTKCMMVVGEEEGGGGGIRKQLMMKSRNSNLKY